jgi:hypothetical protein
MAPKVKAVERLLKFRKESAGKYRYVMKADLYTSLTQAKVIKEVALRSGGILGVMKASTAESKRCPFRPFYSSAASSNWTTT